MPWHHTIQAVCFGVPGVLFSLQVVLLAAHQPMSSSCAGSCLLHCSLELASSCRAAASAQTSAQLPLPQLQQLGLTAAARVVMMTWRSHCCRSSQLFVAAAVLAIAAAV
jgi:hypothetical protein